MSTMSAINTPVRGAMIAALTQRSTAPIVKNALSTSCTFLSKSSAKTCTRPKAVSRAVACQGRHIADRHAPTHRARCQVQQ